MPGLPYNPINSLRTERVQQALSCLHTVSSQPPPFGLTLPSSPQHLRTSAPRRAAAPLCRRYPQLLYLPSLGACVLAGCMLRRQGCRSNTKFGVSTVDLRPGANRVNRNSLLPKGRDDTRMMSATNTGLFVGTPTAESSSLPGGICVSSVRAPPSGSSSGTLPGQPKGMEVGCLPRLQETPWTMEASRPATPPQPHTGKPLDCSETQACARKRTAAKAPRSSSIVVLNTPLPGVLYGAVSRRRERRNKNKKRASSLAETTTAPPVDTIADAWCINPDHQRHFKLSKGQYGLRSPQAARRCNKNTSTPNAVARRAATAGGTRRFPRDTAAVVLLLSWAAFFGAETLRRGQHWNSERILFESALQVCPDGIKTLNNLAAGMLNVDEAGRAEGLLRRAVKVSKHWGEGWVYQGAPDRTVLYRWFIVDVALIKTFDSCSRRDKRFTRLVAVVCLPPLHKTAQGAYPLRFRLTGAMRGR